MIGSIINGETYCDVCGQIVTDAVEKLLANIPAIRARTEEGIRILIEALLLSGVTIMIVGHTRAVASVEHNIAHYWEMMQLLHGHHPPAHGASVGGFNAALLAAVYPLYAGGSIWVEHPGHPAAAHFARCAAGLDAACL